MFIYSIYMVAWYNMKRESHTSASALAFLYIVRLPKIPCKENLCAGYSNEIVVFLSGPEEGKPNTASL